VLGVREEARVEDLFDKRMLLEMGCDRQSREAMLEAAQRKRFDRPSEQEAVERRRIGPGRHLEPLHALAELFEALAKNDDAPDDLLKGSKGIRLKCQSRTRRRVGQDGRTSLCPPMYLVVDCMTMSAPWTRGLLK
jgi:hypothetical protein